MYHVGSTEGGKVMSIVMMASFCSDEEALAAVAAGRRIKIVRDYPGHEEGIRHGAGCPYHGKRQGEDKEFTPECVQHADRYGDRCVRFGPLYMETTYEGAVLDTGEMNYHDDSDFYAVVWDEVAGTVRRIEYASTRGWTYPNGAVVDATPETREKACAYLRRMGLEAWKIANEARAKKPDIDKVVRVTSGKHRGKEGVVFYRQDRRSRYGTWSYGFRLGITMDGIKTGRLYSNVVWVDEDKVEVVDWERYLRPVEEGERYADERANNPRSATAVPGMAFL
jgi:hypothetical protein